MKNPGGLSLTALVLVPLLLGPSGCSLFTGSTQTLSLMCTEPRAEIYVDGERVGTGNASVPVRRNRDHAIMARIGDRVATRHVGTTLSTTGILDVVGTVFFLFPILGLLSPGFFSLDTDSVILHLPPAPE